MRLLKLRSLSLLVLAQLWLASCQSAPRKPSDLKSPRGGGGLPTLTTPDSIMNADLTYEEFVKPLMDRYCISCHSVGTLDAFPALETYLDLEREAESSLRTMQGEINPMPPDGQLEDRVVERFEKWIKAGLPE